MKNSPVSPNSGYYRFPTLHENVIVFTAEGDLWKVDASGGAAQRLTTHHGVESHAAISGDGSTIAFSAQYDGPTEVYSMPTMGGRPTRHTFEGETALVVGWTPSGQILYSTRNYSTLPDTQLATVDPQSGEHVLIPLHQASAGSITPDGKTLYFTRLPRQGSDTKRYMGGWVENIWSFNLSKRKKKKEAIPLTSDYLGTSKDPMVWEERVYFASDRDGTMNIWSMNKDGNDLQQHTDHSGWDIKSPSLHNGRIVYHCGADIYLYDIKRACVEVVPITLASDFDQTRERWVKAPYSYIEDWNLSPTGDRLAITARGRIFVFPTKQGRSVEVTRKHGVRYRDAAFLPKGDSLIALSDESGEMEFWTFPADGIGPGEAITADGSAFRYGCTPSPDGKWLIYGTRDRDLWLTELGSKTNKRIATSINSEFLAGSWSPDSRWLAYSVQATNQYVQIWLYSRENDTHTPITSDRVDSRSPAWSPDGKWLYFVSLRNFESMVDSPWGQRQPEPYFEKTSKIYMLALQDGLRSPFQSDDELVSAGLAEDRNDRGSSSQAKRASDKTSMDGHLVSETAGKEEQIDVQARNQNAGGPASTDKPAHKSADSPTVDGPANVLIDLEGLRERIFEVPLVRGDYYGVQVTKSHIYWCERTRGYQPKYNLKAMPLKNQDREVQSIISDIYGHQLSEDKKKILVRKKNNFYVLDANGEAPKSLDKQRVRLNGWNFAIEPREEWRQMLFEAWRLERDYFYDPNMHGVDWEAQLERHLPLVERVRSRDELDDLIAHMISELSALHTDIREGEKRTGSEREGTGSLGARLIPGDGGYRIEQIYRSDPDYIQKRGPLERPDLKIKEGDVIEAINGIELNGAESNRAISEDQPTYHPWSLLKNKVGLQVRLRIRSATVECSVENLQPKSKTKANAKSKSKKKDKSKSESKITLQQEADVREVIVRPISSYRETELRYESWEYQRRLMVEELGQGEIGYVHLKAMKGENYTEWAKNFYPVFDRSGLIVDVRHNRGGNIDSWILEKLMRRAWLNWKPRVGKPYWNMQQAFRGHMVVLCNEKTASDGETLTDGFRRLGLGTIIGKRTWGGGIWLSPNTRLVDKGLTRTAQIGVFTPEGEWAIEGHGVDPDIVVDNLPHATFNGQDAQLEAAITHLQTLLKRDPIPEIKTPPYPDKSFKYRD